MMHLCGVVIFLFYAAIYHGAAMYNSSTACWKGSEENQFYEATCKLNSTNERGIIAVKRIYYGAKPDWNLCESTDQASVCCTQVEGQDCFFPNQPGELPPDIVSSCSGREYCLTQGKKKRTSNCPDPALFINSYFTTYSYMEFDCVNIGLLTDICHDGIIKTGEDLYIASNIYHTNTEHSDKTCNCIMTTSCGAAIQVDAVDVRLAKKSSTCIEELVFKDNKNASSTRTVDCLQTDLNAFTPIYTSQSNSADVDMNIFGNHTGKLWLRVSSTWANATVQLRCGVTAGLDTTMEHLCPEDLETTPASTTTSTTTPTTTTTATTRTTAEQQKCAPGAGEGCAPVDPEGISGLPIGAIIGIIIAGIIILLVIILILVLMFKRNHKPDDHDYDIPEPRNPDYEIMRYQNPSSKPPNEANAFENPAYSQPVPEKEGAVGYDPDYDQLQSELPEYDNHLNNSVMVVPKGAVM